MAVNTIILRRDIGKWKKITSIIQLAKLDPKSDEAKAFNALSAFYKGDFNKVEFEKQIGNIKSNLNKYAANRNLQTALKEFATICTLWLIKTDEEFKAFKSGIDALDTTTPVVEERKQETKQDNTAVNTILLTRDVEKFRKLAYVINGDFETLDVEDQSAFEVLSKYYNRTFDKKECEELISGIKSNLNKYSSKRDLQAALKDFAATCTVWYTKSEFEFNVFKKAMGGRERKPVVIDPKNQHTPPPPEPKVVFGKNRIDYSNGEYYVGEYSNEQPNGAGKYYYPSGNWQEGFFTDGYLNGKGAEYYADTERADRGEYNRGNRTGKGVMLWKNGNRYEGEWTNEGANGKGKFTYSNGSWEEGVFLNGRLNGQGKYYNAENKYTESGNYSHGVLVGNSVTLWDSGLKFTGTMIDAQNGEGTMYYTDFTKEKGLYINGKWTPQGKRITGGANVFVNVFMRIWENLMFLPWVITVVAAILEWIGNPWSGTFWGIAIGGSVASFILMYIIEIVKVIIEWLWEHKWIPIAVIVIIIAGNVWNNKLFLKNNFIKKKVETEQTYNYKTATVTARSLNIRALANIQSTVVATAQKGDKLYLLGEVSNNWIYVQDGSGRKGYVNVEYISIANTGDAGDAGAAGDAGKTGDANNAGAANNANNAGKQAKTAARINIPATQGAMNVENAYNTFLKKKRITAAERKELQIDKIAMNELRAQPNKSIIWGKTVYSAENAGRLLTILHLVENHSLTEYLVSYDADRNFLDCILIGQNLRYAGDMQTGSIKGNAVACAYSWAELDTWGDGINSVYTVTDDLHFLDFAFPPATFPAVTPFMTEETEEAALFWKIESVVCTGLSGGKYTFTVKGKGTTDCRETDKDERSVRFEPDKRGWEPAGEAVKATFPATGGGEAFQMEISVPQKAIEGNSFYAFKIKK
jgi:hypothetical protein